VFDTVIGDLTMNRIDKKFAELKNENKKALIPYICAGDPSLEMTEKLIPMLERAGADIVELGVPFSDPLADGPVIQAASLRSLGAGFKLDKFFATVVNIRKSSELPLVCMVYYSTIFGYGAEKFVQKCVESGIDGLIVPDLPYEEYDEFKPIVDKTDLALIPLVAITSGDRIEMITKVGKGFVYCVSSLGVTGERNSFDTRVDDFLKAVKAVSDIPVCVGFGISKREDVARFEQITDGAIVGSAIVRKIHECIENNDLDSAEKFVRELKG
jgi:tryptophan synthase alpha chain